MIRCLLGLGLWVLLAGCTTTTTDYYTPTVESWRGSQVNTLISRWGAPDETETSADGNKLLIYKTPGYRTSNTTASPPVGLHLTPEGKPILDATPSTPQEPMPLNCSAVFVANPQGVIIHTKVQGTCHGNQQFANARANH